MLTRVLILKDADVIIDLLSKDDLGPIMLDVIQKRDAP